MARLVISGVFLFFIGLLGYIIKKWLDQPKEIERKFLVKNFSFAMIPDDAKAYDIFQDYLVSWFGWTSRVRRKTLIDGDGKTVYTYTRKMPTGIPGICYEYEREISEAKYRKLLAKRDLATRTIHKIRHEFIYKGHLLELDVFADLPKFPNLVELEVELDDINEPLELPSEMDLEEVTGDSRYSNRSLAAL